MASPTNVKKIASTLTSAEPDGDGVIVRFTPRRGHPPEIENRIAFGPPGEMAAVSGIGRFLRLLRAARVRAPEDPYALHKDPERAAALLRRCSGTLVDLHVRRRYDRGLTLWTENGVERIGGVVDYNESPEGLDIRRRGGRSVLHVARKSLIRFELTSVEYYEIVSLESSP